MDLLPHSPTLTLWAHGQYGSISIVLSCLVYYSTGLLVEYHVEVVVRVLRRSGGGGIKVPFNVRLEGCRRVQLHRSGWKTIPRADSSRGEGKFEWGSVWPKGAKFIFMVGPSTAVRWSITQFLKDLKWRPLADRRRDHRIILLHKILHGSINTPHHTHTPPHPHPHRPPPTRPRATPKSSPLWNSTIF